MIVTRAASKVSFQCVRVSEQCLLQPSRTGIVSTTHQYSTITNRACSFGHQRRNPRVSGNLSERQTFEFKRRSGILDARRRFSTSPIVLHGDLTPPKPGEELRITFVDKDGDESTFTVAKGDNLLDIAIANDIEMEGACGGSCACSTCHIIVEDETLYEKMDEPDDDENDMLDLAFGLTETSRLGCQVTMNKELDGLRVRLPSMTRNLQASDFSKKNERSD